MLAVSEPLHGCSRPQCVPVRLLTEAVREALYRNPVAPAVPLKLLVGVTLVDAVDTLLASTAAACSTEWSIHVAHAPEQSLCRLRTAARAARMRLTAVSVSAWAETAVAAPALTAKLICVHQSNQRRFDPAAALAPARTSASLGAAYTSPVPVKVSWLARKPAGHADVGADAAASAVLGAWLGVSWAREPTARHKAASRAAITAGMSRACGGKASQRQALSNVSVQLSGTSLLLWVGESESQSHSHSSAP